MPRTMTGTRHVLAVLTALVAAAGLVVPTARASEPPAPTFNDSPGIHVSSVTRIASLERTWQVTYSTPSVADSQTFDGRMALRVTLPRTYWQDPNSRYPVLYLLHGGGEARVRDWTDESGRQGRAEQITADSDIITVTPEGGRVSWYSDWVKEGKGSARWESHHINEVIPFVDANLRTLADGHHRAIAGLSMGGYGAFHYAIHHPGTFASVSSYSGGLDLANALQRATVAEQLAVTTSPREPSGDRWCCPTRTSWRPARPSRGAWRGWPSCSARGSGSPCIREPVSALPSRVRWPSRPGWGGRPPPSTRDWLRAG